VAAAGAVGAGFAALPTVTPESSPALDSPFELAPRLGGWMEDLAQDVSEDAHDMLSWLRLGSSAGGVGVI
jgi:hypothetical protein